MSSSTAQPRGVIPMSLEDTQGEIPRTKEPSVEVKRQPVLHDHKGVAPMDFGQDKDKSRPRTPGIPVALQSALVESYIDRFTVARTHIETMDFWVNKMMNGSAEFFPEIGPSPTEKKAGLDFSIRFLHVRMEAPTFMKQTATSCTDMPFVPNAARQGNYDYSQRQHIRVRVRPCGADASKCFETELFAGRPLTMVRSNMCALSASGRTKSLDLHRAHRQQVIGCQVGNGMAPVPLKQAETMDLDQFAVKMGECPWDRGGYFIVHGTEKVVVHQEYRRVNVVSVTNNDVNASGRLGKLSKFVNEVVDEDKAAESAENASGEARVEDEPEQYPEKKAKKAGAPKKSADAKTTKSSKKNERKNSLHASFMSQCGEDVRTIVYVLMDNRTGVFRISIDHVTKTMPLFLLFHSLGVETRQGVLDLLCHKLRPELAERMRIEMEPSAQLLNREKMTRADADKYIDKHFRGSVPVYGSTAPEDNTEEKRLAWYRNSIRRSFLQHIGKDDLPATRMKKAQLVAHITQMLCLVRWGLRAPDSPDHLQQKSVATSGRLMYVLWLDAMRRAWAEMSQQVRSQVAENPMVVNNLHDKFNPESVTVAIRQAVATGNWPAFDYSGKPQSGVSQTLERKNHEDYAATMSRVVNKLKNTHHASESMELHHTCNGIYDPSATSDLVPGLVKQLCTFTHVTCGAAEQEQERLGATVESFLDNSLEGHMVLFNGVVLGYTKRVQLLEHEIRSQRAVGRLYRSVSIVTDHDSMTCVIQSEHGRHVRTLARVADTKVLMDSDSCDTSMQKRYVEIAKGLGLVDKQSKHRPRIDVVRDALEGQRLRRTLGATDKCRAASGPCVLHKLVCMKFDRQPDDRWRYLETQGYVDNLDIAELWSPIVIARPFADAVQHKDATHGELGPSYLLGPASAVAHMVGNVHTARMLNVNHLARSAIGIPHSNTGTRFVRGEGQHVLRYPQQIHGTPYARATGQLELSNKQLPIVAVAESWGFGQEDAVVPNRSSQQRGYGVSDRVVTFPVTVTLKHPKEHIAKQKSEWSTIVHPLAFADGPVDKTKFPDYDLLPPVPVKCLNLRYAGDSKTPHVCSEHCSISPFATSGIATLHQTVKYDQVLVGIVRSFVDPVTKTTRHVDASFRMPVKHQTGVISKILVVQHDETQVTIHVTVVFELDPYDGQKSAFAYGQKGVQDVALGQEEMIWTASGVVPDIVICEQGFPTRMTVNMLLAMFSGKAGLVVRELLREQLDHLRDQDNFEVVDVKLISQALRGAGYVSSGSEVMYCPRTGKRLKGRIFIGPAAVHKSPHMPEEKTHARSLGAKTIGTGQPVKGRSADGGIKFGEMEAKILIIAGASENLLQWLMENSDATEMPLCDVCGMAAVAAPEVSGRKWMCRMCGYDSEVIEIRLPGSAAQLTRILSFANINLRVFAEKQPGFGDSDLEDPGNYLDMLNASIAKRLSVSQ